MARIGVIGQGLDFDLQVYFRQREISYEMIDATNIATKAAGGFGDFQFLIFPPRLAFHDRETFDVFEKKTCKRELDTFLANAGRILMFPPALLPSDFHNVLWGDDFVVLRWFGQTQIDFTMTKTRNTKGCQVVDYMPETNKFSKSRLDSFTYGIYCYHEVFHEDDIDYLILSPRENTIATRFFCNGGEILLSNFTPGVENYPQLDVIMRWGAFGKKIRSIPSQTSSTWTAQEKAWLVMALLKGEIDFETATHLYKVPKSLVEEWRDTFIQAGEKALGGLIRDSGNGPSELLGDVDVRSDKGLSWLKHIPKKYRHFFQTLDERGSLAEEDAAIILGNARKVRRLRNDLESLQEHLPFRIRVRSAKGKLKYIREKKGEVFKMSQG